MHRTRYGLGQLLDYRVRDAGWIADVLQQNGVAFVASVEGHIVPFNNLVREKRLFAA